MTISLPKLPRIKGFPVIGKPKKFEGPAPIRQKAITSEMSPRIKRAYYSLCGAPERRAELVYRFEALLEQFPTMTLPEGLFYTLLEERDISFSYQEAMLGGRSELGGAVTDFVLRMGGYALAILVNGDYWHSLAPQVMRDIETKERVVGQYFEGMMVTQALEIWESTLLSCDRERAVDLILTGVEVGKTA